MKSPVERGQPILCEETNAPSSPRSFGFVFTVFFLLVALAPLTKRGAIRLWPLLVAGAFFLCAIFAPQLLALPNKLWTRFGLLLHRITQPLIMALLFFLVITPLGCLMRLCKGDSLRRKWDAGAETYWITRTPPGPTPESMKHLF